MLCVDVDGSSRILRDIHDLDRAILLRSQSHIVEVTILWERCRVRMYAIREFHRLNA